MENRRERFMKKARESVREALRSRDMLLSGVTKSIDMQNKVLNMLGERLEEWYAIYFPEMRMEDRQKFAEAVLALDRKAPEVKELAAILGQKKAQEVAESARSSLGADLKGEDVAEIQAFASAILSMYRQKERMEGHQRQLAQEICPNMSEVAGPELAAKLVAHVGSLRKLALLPASTLQVLGAEKALFKHLRNRKIKPPKHGLLFQHPKISGSPKRARGRIARTLANKLALAAKADAFTRRSIGAKLREDFDRRCGEILEACKREKETAKGREAEA